ncbi:voltage-gated potassium channel [Aureococcus anophagefferens]|uniref:Voltage-gated potassium channel n=1 Tax=Aureococcus anophagefferens TaxID=44056 RepID=A0ABR1FYJ4_AURAN
MSQFVASDVEEWDELPAAAAATEKTVEFPTQAGAWLSVFSPHAPWRLWWDASMLLCTCFVVLVTPFELTFVDNRSSGCAPGRHDLDLANLVVNSIFVADMGMCFNTSYFSARRGTWVVTRGRIARRYFGSWFLFDATSCVPFECATLRSADSAGASARYLRLIRVLRFFKLLKVMKSPRILNAMARHVDFSSKLQTVLKYILMLLVMVHWSACLLRLLTLVACDAGRGEDRGAGGARGCPNTVLTMGYNWGDGIWATYVEAAVWANMALNGEATYFLHSEGLLGIFIMLCGFILLGFLLGELTNTLSNLDPVGNQFKMTKDSLSEFMTKHNFAPALRNKLREYISLYEPVFRDHHYNSVLSMLSPRFRLVVAKHVSGYLVTRIPFIRYTSQHVHGIKEGVRLHLFPREGRATTRAAVVVGVPNYLTYDVRYADDGSRETVPHSRVDVLRSLPDPATQRRVFRLVYETDLLVVRIAQNFEVQLYMAHDTVVHRDMNVNDALYMIENGHCLLFGAHSTDQFRCESRVSSEYFGEDVAAQLAGFRKPELVHYAVKTFRLSHLKVLAGEVLLRILTERPSFALHRKYCHRYGCWLLVKAAMIRRFREGRARDQGDITNAAPEVLHRSDRRGSLLRSPLAVSGAELREAGREDARWTAAAGAGAGGAPAELPPLRATRRDSRPRAFDGPDADVHGLLARHFVARATADAPAPRGFAARRPDRPGFSPPAGGFAAAVAAADAAPPDRPETSPVSKFKP